MPRKNRGYKRGEPFRSSKIILIVAEGSKREIDYLQCFSLCSLKIKIRFVEPLKEGASSPKHFLNRIEKFREEFKNEDSEEDSLWFICDMDKWPEEQLREIEEECQGQPNWNLAISNPCFEIWLLMHFWNVQQIEGETSKDFKRELNKRGGKYKPKDFIVRIDDAIAQAKESDDNPRYFIPNFKQTKLYLLGETIIDIIGQNWKDNARLL